MYGKDAASPRSFKYDLLHPWCSQRAKAEVPAQLLAHQLLSYLSTTQPTSVHSHDNYAGLLQLDTTLPFFDAAPELLKTMGNIVPVVEAWR